MSAILLAILVFLAYLIGAIAIGIVASRRQSEEDFMIASRRVSGVQMVATMTAGLFDGAALSIYIAYVYQFGFSAIWFFLGISLGFLLFRALASRIKRRADGMHVYSMPEYFFRLFSRRTGIMFSIFLVIQFFGYLVVNFIISGKVLAYIFPFLPYPAAVIVGGVVILTYLLLAGFRAVVRTDFYQLVIMIVMSVTVGTYLARGTTFSPADFDLLQLGTGNIVGFLLLAGLGVIVAPDLWQRVFAAKDERNLRLGFGWGAILLPILAIIITTVGLSTKHHFPGIRPEDSLVVGFAALLPYGLREFGLVLLYAVALSSSDTVTFVVSSIFTRDFKNYTRRFGDESMTRLTRWFMVSFVVAALLVAVTYTRIVPLALALASLNLALFPAVFASLFWKLKERAVFWSLVTTLVGVGILALAGPLTPETAAGSLPVALLALLAFQCIFRREQVAAPTSPARS